MSCHLAIKICDEVFKANSEFVISSHGDTEGRSSHVIYMYTTGGFPYNLCQPSVSFDRSDTAYVDRS